ncbi:MAG: hypothetical protein J6W29_07395 [Neisseriaceae bacterium]|nr:hypothetical protein [Neisseriaceae bacterium]
MEETLSIHCRERFSLNFYSLLPSSLVFSCLIFFSEDIFVAIFFFFLCCTLYIPFFLLSYLYKKTIISTINITPTGIEIIQPNINQQSLFLWQNIQKIKHISISNAYIYPYRPLKQRYNEKISIQTKDKQTKTFVFALDTQYGKKQQPEYLVYDEHIYEKLHKEIYQILQHYTLKHQIHYIENYIQRHTDINLSDEIIITSPLGKVIVFIFKAFIFVLESIIFLILSTFLATIIKNIFTQKDLTLLIPAILMLILWCIIATLLGKHIKQRKKK